MDQSSSGKTLRRYLLFQIPEAIFVGLLLAGLHYFGLISLPIAVGLFAAWCVKDAVMYRFVRSAYGPGPLHGTAALVGKSGVVVRALAPEGSVRLGAEHWSARTAAGVSQLSLGTRVRVVSVEGYVVTVVQS